MGGDGAILQIVWFDDEDSPHIETAYVGRGGVLPDRPYRLDAEHRFALADDIAAGTRGVQP